MLAKCWWRSNIRWEAKEICCRLFRHPYPMGPSSQNCHWRQCLSFTSSIHPPECLYPIKSLLVKGLHSLFMLPFALCKALCFYEAPVHKMVSVCSWKPTPFSTHHSWLGLSWVTWNSSIFFSQVESLTRWQKCFSFENTLAASSDPFVIISWLAQGKLKPSILKWTYYLSR